MKKTTFLTVAVLFFVTTNLVWAENDALLKVVKDKARKILIALVQDPIVVGAVRSANRTREIITDQNVVLLEKEWQRESGKNDLVSEVLENSCSDHLKKIITDNIDEKKSVYSEILVMDKYGGLVASTDKTSDYWQGDEDKFIKSFGYGEKTLFIGDPRFDESTQTYSIQVSMPIIDAGTKNSIGVLMVGLDLDILAIQNLE